MFREIETCPDDFIYKENHYGKLGKIWLERQRRGWYTNKLSLNLLNVEEYDVTRFKTTDDYVIIYTTEHKDRLVFYKHKVSYKHSNKLKLRC